MPRNVSIRSASNPRLGGSCHSSGPSLVSSASTPEAKKLASGVSIPFSFFMWVMNRPPLTANSKSSGTAAAHDAYADRRCSE